MKKRSWREMIHNENGQGLAEYAFLLGLLALLCVAAMTALSNKIGTLSGEYENAIAGG